MDPQPKMGAVHESIGSLRDLWEVRPNCPMVVDRLSEEGGVGLQKEAGQQDSSAGGQALG